MMPFSIESYGAIGESARQLLLKLDSKSDDTSGHAFLQQAYSRLSVALQAANAAITIGGLQRLRLDQLSGDLPMSPNLNGRPPSRRRTQRYLTQVHHRRMNLSAAFHGGFRMATAGAISHMLSRPPTAIMGDLYSNSWTLCAEACVAEDHA